MEPAVIDWKKVESNYIRDDAYEHFNAPKWLDLSAPDSLSSSIDPDAWFCRPDCRHPKTHQDFLIPSPKLKSPSLRSPLGERKPNNQRDANNANNRLKRRGGMGALLPISSSSPLRDPVKNKTNGKKFREDLENQNPNLLVDSKTMTSTSKPMKPANKEAIKSSAVKRGSEEEENERPALKLRSTLSARNLFSGRDILGQISEFCHEIKKLAVGREKNFAAKDLVREEEKKEVSKDPNLKGTDPSAKKRERLVVDVEKCKKGVLKEVRAYPPTPQKFPSPLNNKPLKPVAPERGILQELEQGKEEKKAMEVKENEGNNNNNNNNKVSAVDSEEVSSMDMFWFFKPCTYLVE